MKKFLILISIVFLFEINNTFAQQTMADSLSIDMVSIYFQYKYNKLLKSMNLDTLSLNEVKKTITFDRRVLPFLQNTIFFRYYSSWSEPGSYAILYSSKNEKDILNKYRGKYNDSIIVTDKFLKKLNELLINEVQNFTKNELLEIISFIFWQKNYHDKGICILNDYKEILSDTAHTIPDSIKQMIKPMQFSETNKKIILKFYAWDASSAFLHRVSVTYIDKIIEFKSKIIGRFGYTSVRI